MNLDRNTAIAWVLAVVSVAQGAQVDTGSGPAVRVAITDQKFCLGEPGFVSFEHQHPDTITFRLRVELYYRNTGSKPLILPTSKDTVVILSRSSADARRRQNQFHIRLREKRLPEDEDLEARGIELDRPREPYFQVIPPGKEGSVALPEYVVLRVHNPSDKQVQTELLGKKIFIQLELDHSQLPKQLAKKLTDRWRQYGDLWTGKATTEVMEFDIPLSPKFADCSLEYRID